MIFHLEHMDIMTYRLAVRTTKRALRGAAASILAALCASSSSATSNVGKEGDEGVSIIAKHSTR